MMTTLLKEEFEIYVKDLYTGQFPSREAPEKLRALLDHDQAQRAVIAELRNLCLKAYQVVGSLAGDAGMFEHTATIKVLDNLSMAGVGKPVPHKELLPFPASQKIEQQAKEITELREALQIGFNRNQEEGVS